MTKSTSTPSPSAWRDFSAYLKDRSRTCGLSRDLLAAALKMNPAHLSRLLSGRTTPLPDTCFRIAAHFGDEPALVLQLAGFMKADDTDVDGVLQAYQSAVSQDPDLKMLQEKYQLDERPGRTWLDELLGR